MKVAKELPGRAKSGRKAFDWYGAFEAAGERQNGRLVWVQVKVWNNRFSGPQVKRAVAAGDVKVPGGAKAWELETRAEGDGEWGLWVRKRRGTHPRRAS